jgi:serine/threonine protein kinase/tetratricopeptide (TPR) repeat protein
MIGTTVSHYRVLEKVGAGGMGVVYKAQDIRLGRFVALKFLPDNFADDPQLRERFQREARAASGLSHHNICTIYDIGDADGRPFMAMEFLDGVTLKDLVLGGPLELPRLVDIAIQVLDGLEAAHTQGIIHRDVKPANISVTNKNRVKILDFGLAKFNGPVRAKASVGGEETLGSGSAEYLTTGYGALGTMPYMSPEQALGTTLDTRTDLFSFGVTLYEMATGKMPFQGDTTGVLFLSIVKDNPLPAMQVNPDVPAELQRIIDKCLEKDRDLRYQYAGDVRSDLKRLRRDSHVSWSGVAGVMDSEPAEVAATKARASSPSAQPSRAPLPASLDATSTRLLSWKMWASLAVLLIAMAVSGVTYWRSHKKVALTDKDTIVLADFTNTTGDTVLDETLRQALSVDLEQSPFLRIIPEQQVQETLRLMGKPADARLTPEIAREVCQRTNSTVALHGSIAQIGTEYSLDLKAVNCASDESLATTEAQATDKNHILDALNMAASSIRTELGESLSMVQKFATPVEQATTPSLDALHAFSLGVKTKDITGDEAAVPLFEEAIKLDPGFAMAYALLGTSYSNLEERSRGAEMLKKAYDLREKVSEHEKFYIEAYYYDIVLGDLTKAMQEYELWAQVYPRDDRPVGNLGLIYGYIGQHEKAVAQAREALRLQSESGLRYANLVQGYVHVGRLPEARSTVEEARTKNVDSPYLNLYSYQLAFVQNDVTKMTEELARAAGKPGVEDMLLAAEADTAAYVGQVLAPRDFSRQAIASAKRAAEKETAASYEAAAALREGLFGNPDVARQHAEAALAISKGRDVQYASALALAFAGAGQRAQQLSEQLSMDFPDDTLVRSVYLPTIRGEIAVSHRDSSNAIELLKTTSQYELGMPGDAEFSPSLYPVYVRGNAYLAAGQGGEAAAEFEKILKWPGVVLNEPIAALAPLGLARAYALQGDSVKARSAYQDFLTLWKNADPGVPVLKLAKAEYAKL